MKNAEHINYVKKKNEWMSEAPTSDDGLTMTPRVRDY